LHGDVDKFAKFIDNKGRLESLINDARGMLSLYEAAYLRVHGEDILDEALVLTATHLEAVASHLSPSLPAKVSHALKQPIHKGLPRLEARHYCSMNQKEASHNKILLTIVKLDFNIHIAEIAPKRAFRDCKVSYRSSHVTHY
jgi:(-)-germacrene D synthase